MASIETTLKEKRKDMFLVDPRNILSDENFNVRKDYGDIEELALSIAAVGVQQPLRCYRSSDDTTKYHLVDGFRRMRAINMAIENGFEIARIPVLLEPKSYTLDKRVLDMFTLNSSKSLEPIEEGELFMRLEQFNWTRKEIAEKTGRSEAHISNRIILITSDPEIKKAVEDKKISATTAQKVLQDEKNPEEQKQLIKDAIKYAEESGKTKATAKHVAKAKNGGKEKKKEEPKRREDKTLGKLKLLNDKIHEKIKNERIGTLRMLLSFLNGEVDNKTIHNFLTISSSKVDIPQVPDEFDEQEEENIPAEMQ